MCSNSIEQNKSMDVLRYCVIISFRYKKKTFWETSNIKLAKALVTTNEFNFIIESFVCWSANSQMTSSNEKKCKYCCFFHKNSYKTMQTLNMFEFRVFGNSIIIHSFYVVLCCEKQLVVKYHETPFPNPAVKIRRSTVSNRTMVCFFFFKNIATKNTKANKSARCQRTHWISVLNTEYT